jgi:hypothetical protein
MALYLMVAEYLHFVHRFMSSLSVIRSVTVCTSHRILFCDQTKSVVKGVASDTYGGDQRCIQNFGGETKGRRLLGRSWHKRYDAIKMDLKDIERGFMDFIHLARDMETFLALVKKVMNIRVL